MPTRHHSSSPPPPPAPPHLAHRVQPTGFGNTPSGSDKITQIMQDACVSAGKALQALPGHTALRAKVPQPLWRLGSYCSHCWPPRSGPVLVPSLCDMHGASKPVCTAEGTAATGSGNRYNRHSSRHCGVAQPSPQPSQGRVSPHLVCLIPLVTHLCTSSLLLWR